MRPQVCPYAINGIIVLRQSARFLAIFSSHVEFWGNWSDAVRNIKRRIGQWNNQLHIEQGITLYRLPARSTGSLLQENNSHWD